MKRSLSALLVLAVIGATLAAVADARRAPTRGERSAIAAAVKRHHGSATPRSCYPLIMAVSTVNKNYASASFRANAQCGIVVGNGVFVLRRVRRGLWRVLSEGTEHPCREAPRGVIRDLLGRCV